MLPHSCACFLFQLIIYCLSPRKINSFSPSSFGFGPLTEISGFGRNKLYPRHLSGDDKTEEFMFETVEIRQLITEISFEKNDEIRRRKVECTLMENIDQNDAEAGARFAMLWDKTLIEIGGEIQNAARAKVEIKNKDKQELNGTKNGKSDEELKLWALVDMMVQSKALIKKLGDE